MQKNIKIIAWLANFTLNIYGALKYSDFNRNASGPMPGPSNQDCRIAVGDGCWDFKRNKKNL
jgi:hypothetical protein